MEHILFYDCLRYLLLLGHGGPVNKSEEEHPGSLNKQITDLQRGLKSSHWLCQGLLKRAAGEDHFLFRGVL